MRRRFLQVSFVAAAAVLWVASPAMAHEEITPSTIPTGKPAFFTLTAANEKNVDLTKITIAAPEGVPFGTTTRQPSGWTPQKSETEITWTGGKVAPDSFEQWGFEIEGADQPGALSYRVTTGFADGASEDAEVPVTAVAPGAGGESPPATVAPGVTTPSVAPTTLAPAKSSSGSGDGLAVAALIVALLSGLLAGVALIFALRRRGPASPTDPADGATSAKGQDW